MPILIKTADGIPQIKGVKHTPDGQAWNRKRSYVFNGTIWVPNDNIDIYPAIKTRSYDGGKKKGPTEYGVPMAPVSIDAWASDTILRQGAYSYLTYDYWYMSGGTLYDGGNVTCYHGPYYGTMHFGSGAGTPPERADKTLVSAQLSLCRGSSGGDTGPVTVRVWGCSLTDVPASGADTPNGSYVAGTNINLGTLQLNEEKWFDLPLSLAQYPITGKCLVICFGSANYMSLYGIESAAHLPKLKLVWY